ncbi:MAG: hypothetical protein HOE79_04035 [Euryarchaeota archaeon]|jgi:hypothetical protein|nr:hypothetical protein [Euryarchaeota archaeon]
MSGLLDVFMMKERVNDGSNPILIVLEKASMLLTLFIIGTIGYGLNLPEWGIGLLVGASLGPVVYIHYYVLYIRPLKKRGNIDGK